MLLRGSCCVFSCLFFCFLCLFVCVFVCLFFVFDFFVCYSHFFSVWCVLGAYVPYVLTVVLFWGRFVFLLSRYIYTRLKMFLLPTSSFRCVLSQRVSICFSWRVCVYAPLFSAPWFLFGGKKRHEGISCQNDLNSIRTALP